MVAVLGVLGTAIVGVTVKTLLIIVHWGNPPNPHPTPKKKDKPTCGKVVDNTGVVAVLGVLGMAIFGVTVKTLVIMVPWGTAFSAALVNGLEIILPI